MEVYPLVVTKKQYATENGPVKIGEFSREELGDFPCTLLPEGVNHIITINHH